jgi:cyclohexa-1,5-dienecarbonyl-CoA hydratase
VSSPRPVRCSSEHSGQLERIVLDRPKGNVLDTEMIGAIVGRLDELARRPGPLKLLVFEGAGGHFSFGASVEEHLPEHVGRMLPRFHGLFRRLEALSIPTAAVVRGQCLGGGFELAIWCGMVFCEPSARFGVPEIKLGVFPPIAALALPWRVPGVRSVQIILSGEAIPGQEAARLWIADRCDEDAEAALQEWFATDLAGKSAVALRAAWRAARRPLAERFEGDISALEKLYLDDLMAQRDPAEGIRAFLERRAAVWENR